MKFADYIAAAAFILIAAIVFFWPWGANGFAFDFCGSFSDFTGMKNFGYIAGAYPYISGFFKVAVLATFGEMIKTRGRTGSYRTPDLLIKFIVWGLYGMLFTIAFSIFRLGVGAIAKGGVIWWQPFCCDWANHIFVAFSTSFWINVIFCYPMMMSHEWFNTCIARRKFVGGAEFFAGLDPKIWGSFMLKTIVVFWIPAHTITFCLPAQYQILMSAFLSLALGFILTIKPKK